MPQPPNGLNSVQLQKWMDTEYKQWQSRYKSVFKTKEGLIVLVDMLDDLFLNKVITTEGEKALHNYAVQLVNHCNANTIINLK